MLELTVILVVAIGATSFTFLGTRVFAGQSRTLVAASAVIGAVLYALFLLFRPQALILTNIAVLVGSLLIGSGLGLLLSTKTGLVSFVLVASIADVLSASGGITSRISNAYREGSSDLLLLLSVSFRLDGGVRQVIGIGDLIVLGAVFLALNYLGYRGPLPFLAPLGGLMLALVVGLLIGGVSAIPFIAGATILYVSIARVDGAVLGRRA